MSQPSVASYFSTRKRLAYDDLKSTTAKKVIILHDDSAESLLKKPSIETPKERCPTPQFDQIIVPVNSGSLTNTTMGKKQKHLRAKTFKDTSHRQNIQTLLNTTPKQAVQEIIPDVTPTDTVNKEPVHRTPPSTPTKRINAMDKVKPIARELSFNELKQKVSRSSRLADLKASMSRFKQLYSKLQQIEKKTSQSKDSPNLKSFRTIELEVALRCVLIYFNILFYNL